MEKRVFSLRQRLACRRKSGRFPMRRNGGNLLFVTGQMPTDPATGKMVADDLVLQPRQVKDNLSAVLNHFGATMDDTLMVRVYLTDFNDYDAFNREYASWFNGPWPSRTCVGVTGLAAGARVEIDLIAGLQ